MGSKIRAVSREINLQHCRETQPHFISSAPATSAGLRQPPSRPALHNIHTHKDINKTHMFHKLSQRTDSRDVMESQRG